MIPFQHQVSLSSALLLILPSASDVLPSASDIVPAATEGSVVVPGAEGASNGAKKPVVDPTAFVIKEG